jgi:hypothetical protein
MLLIALLMLDYYPSIARIGLPPSIASKGKSMEGKQCRLEFISQGTLS